MIIEKKKSVEVSFFRNKSNVVKDVAFNKIIDAIKQGWVNNEIQRLRELKSKRDKRWKLMKYNLPGFTPSATFHSERGTLNVKSYTQMICLDFDGININLEAENSYTERINSDVYTHASFVSPSATGLKVFIKVGSTQEFHDLAFQQVAEYYEKITGLKVDQSGKDITRLCYFSSDERAYYNESSEVFKVEQRDDVKQDIGGTKVILGKATNIESQFNRVVELTLRKETFVKGNRNHFINLLANNCNRWGISRTDALNLIVHSEYCYNRREVIATIYSAYKNQNQHNTYPSRTVGQNVAVAAAVVQRENATNARFRSFNQLAEEGKLLKPLKKIFGNFILEKSTTLFPSERGVGKSLLAMQIAIKIANGAKEFLGEELEVHGNVLYVNLELGDHTLKKRMEKLLADQNSDSAYQAYSFDERDGFFKSIEIIRDFCQKKQPVLIIIDNLRTAMVGADNENNKVMTSIITEINKLKDEFNSAFLIVHHTKKGSNNQLTNSDMQSGAGALTDLVDADFFLRKSGVEANQRILKRIKARECEEQDGAKLICLNSETLWFELIEDEVDESMYVLDEKSMAFKEKRETKIIQMIKNGMSDATIGKELNINRSTPFRIRKRLAQI